MNSLVKFLLFFCCLIFIAPILALVAEAGQLLFTGQFSLSLDALQRYFSSSAVLLFWSILGAVFFGCFAAYLCSRFDFFGRNLVLFFCILPLGVPSYLVAYTWVDFLVDQGAPGSALRNLPVTCLIFSFCLSPYVFLPVYGALSSVSASLTDSARLLGKRNWQIFFLVELPLIRTSLFSGALLAALEVLADFGTVDFMAVDTWSTGIYRSWFGYGERSSAAFLSLFLFMFSALVMLGELRSRNRNSATMSTRSASLVRRQPLGRACALLYFSLATIPFWASCFFPAVLLVVKSLSPFDPNVWADTLRPTTTSLSLAALTGFVVTVIGLIFAYAVRFSFGKFWLIVVRGASLGYALPGGVIGVGLLILLAPFSLTGTLLGLIIAYCVRFVTIGASTIESSWRTIPKDFDEQARLLGCSQFSVIRRISLPLLHKGLACAFVLTAIDVIKELPATMLLRPFDFETLSIRTYNLASDERLAETAPTALMMIVLSVLGIFLAHRWGAFALNSKTEVLRRHGE